jgi:hypothetical protein
MGVPGSPRTASWSDSHPLPNGLLLSYRMAQAHGILSRRPSSARLHRNEAMNSPPLSAEQISQVSGLVADYISAQRLKALPYAVALGNDQLRSIEGFFLREVLDGVRLLARDGTRLDNPPFYEMLRQMGFNNLPDFSQMAAVTFCDVVVSHQPFSDGLLFHELVHVEQYRQLGIPRFAELYVRGFLTGGGYDGIPLEINAYLLGERFENDPLKRFSVETEVGIWIRAGRF